MNIVNIDRVAIIVFQDRLPVFLKIDFGDLLYLFLHSVIRFPAGDDSLVPEVPLDLRHHIIAIEFRDGLFEILIQHNL